MKGYFECSKCRNQWTREGSTMDNRCPACGLKGGLCEIGTMAKPDWFKEATAPMPSHNPKSFWSRLADVLRGKP